MGSSSHQKHIYVPEDPQLEEEEEVAHDKEVSHSSILLQHYISGKQSNLSTSKSEYFMPPKEK